MNTRILFPILLFLSAGLLQAQNWPAWRGTDANGVAAPGNYPVELNAGKTAWKAVIGGRGSSTPIVWNGKVVITAGVEGQDSAQCYDLKTGNRLWQKALGAERAGKHRNGSGSCPSAVTDGSSVYVYFKSGTVASLDWDGNLQWKTNLQETYGEDSLWWDLGTSPVLADGKVIIAVMHEGNSYMVALNAADGKEAWKVDRNFKCQKESHQSYTTPVVMKQNGETALVTFGADHLTAHAADDGELMWTCGGFNPTDEAYWRVIASPAVTDGVAVVPYGRANHCLGVRIGDGGKGDLTDRALWNRKDLGTDVPTPVAIDGRAYLLSDKKSALHCLDVKTGRDLWSFTYPKGRGKFYGSPTIAGNLVYTFRDDGKAFVGKVTDAGFELLAENDMGERLASSPVLVDGRLLVRGEEHLFCID